MGSFGISFGWGRISGPRWTFVTAVAEFVFWLVCAVHIKAWSRMLHFTWWGIVFHAFTVFASIVGAADWNTDICLQIAVVTGVWYMSACECSMLVNTEADMGAAEYAAGNFLVHYMPTVSAVARRPFHAKRTPPRPGSVLLWLAYNALSLHHGITPSETYGCNAPFELVVMTGITATLLATFFLHNFGA